MATARRALSEWISGQVPQTMPRDDVPRAEVFLITAWLSLFLSVLSCTAALFNGLTVLAASNSLDAIVVVLVLRWFRKDDAALRVRAVRVYLAFFTVSLSFGSLTVSPMDETTLCFLFLLPLVAALMLDAKETIPWFRRAMLAGGLALVAAHFGWVVPHRDPSPLFTHLLNFIGSLTCAMALLKALARDRERAIERIRETDRAKTAFFANVGHDIRTPMNGVLGMADVLLEQSLDVKQREMVQVIRSSGGVLLALIDEVLDLSRLEAGQLVLRPAPVALHGLLNEIRTLWSPVAQKKGIALTMAVDPSVPEAALLDGLRVRQILNNVINNAVKFTSKGSITLKLWVANQRLVFEVADTGIGISAAQQAKLFARFAQADDARARDNQGSGLGLALSRQLAQHMGGSLELNSTEGQGTRLVCELPWVRCELPVVSNAAAAQLPTGLRVLVVDDNAVNRLVAQRLLHMNGCAVECAPDGRSAIAALSRNTFDIVLMDVHMPEMDGLETTRHIIEHTDERPRIIGLSASAAQADVESCRSAGMVDFLAKPINQERLVAVLLRHV